MGPIARPPKHGFEVVLFIPVCVAIVISAVIAVVVVVVVPTPNPVTPAPCQLGTLCAPLVDPTEAGKQSLSFPVLSTKSNASDSGSTVGSTTQDDQAYYR